MSNNINKKALAEKLKQKLNSPDYIAMPDLITYDNRYGDMLAFLWGAGIDGNIYKEGNWINGHNINPGKGNEHDGEHIVMIDELEKDDWGEIVKLIKKRNKEKEQIYDQKRNNIKEKLNHTPNLYYRFSNSKRISTSYFVYPDKQGEYFNILGVENGREYFLNININHSVLNNFPWEKNGYYLIETDKKIERNDEFGRPWSDHGEDNPSNFHKWVEVGDQITINPYQVADQPIEKPKSSKPVENDNNDKLINRGHKNNESKPVAKSSDPEIINSKMADFLLQYFQDNDIKEIKLENDDLVIEYNKNTAATEKNNSQELQLIKNIIQKSDNQQLSQERLKGMVNTNSTQTITTSDNNNKAVWISCGIGGALVIGIVVGYLLLRKKKAKNN